MLRMMACFCVCLLLLAAGCGKEEPPEEPPVTRVKAPVKTPQDMVPVGEAGPLYVTRSPVKVGDYVECLRATNQPVPERWQGIQPDGPGADLPVTGLSRSEAELYAAWAMKSVPTREQWQQAGKIVGTRPYPWRDGEPAEPGTEVFLVRTWRPGSEGEAEARRRKEELPAELLARERRELKALRQELKQKVEALQARRAELWQEAKPAFFKLLEKQKDLVLREAEQKRTEVVEVLRNLWRDKGKLAARLKTQDLSLEETKKAVQAYEQQLTEAVARVESVRQNLQKQVKAAQERVIELTRRMEEVGEEQFARLPESVRSALEKSAQSVQDVREAARLKERLRDAMRELEQSDARAALPTAEELQQKIKEIEAEIQAVTEDEEVSARIEELQSKLHTLSEAVQREFLKEGVLKEKLSELVDLRARKEAIQAKLEALREMLGEQPEAPPEKPAEGPETEEKSTETAGQQ